MYAASSYLAARQSERAWIVLGGGLFIPDFCAEHAKTN
jgi:hypothetical protein